MNIGIEIEFTGVKRENVANSLAKMWRTNVEKYVVQSYDKRDITRYKVKDLKGEYWELVIDHSIRPSCSYNHITLDYDEYMCELVSPVLDSEHLNMLEMALSKICEIGGVVNETCGVHLHLDCPDSGEKLYSIFNTICSQQEQLLSKFGVPYNRLGRYCKLYSPQFIEGIRLLHSTIVKSKGVFSIEDMQNYLYKELGEGTDRNNPRNPARYYIFNMDSIHKQNTIEFRWFNSTLSIIIIYTYILQASMLLNTERG